MPGKDPLLNQLEIRKRLLIAASELHRAHLPGEVDAFRSGIRRLMDSAGSFGSLASLAVTFCAGLVALKRAKPADTETKPSWGQAILRGAGLLSSLWRQFRPPPPDQD